MIRCWNWALTTLMQPLAFYCLARRGDWLTATLVLDASEALGEFTGRTAALFHVYLETQTEDEIDANLPPNLRVSALDYRFIRRHWPAADTRSIATSIRSI